MSLLPARHTLSCWAGGTFRTTITVLTGALNSTPQDLTGYTAVMNIRAAPETTPVYTLSTATGDITLGGTGGTISLYISETNTLAFPIGTPRIYDLSVTAAGGTGDTLPILYGPFRVVGVA